MSDHGSLSGHESIDVSYRLRPEVLGMRQALYDARKHESELRRRFGLVESDWWGTSASEMSVSPQTCGHVKEPMTFTSAAEQFIVTTTTETASTMQALNVLLLHLRKALQMDAAFVTEFVHGHQVCRSFDGLETSKAANALDMAASLTAALCQRAGGQYLPQVSRDTRVEPEMAHLAVVKTLDIGACLSTPIVLRDGTVYGTLCCISQITRPNLGIRQLEALRYIAGIVAIALKRDRSRASRAVSL